MPAPGVERVDDAPLHCGGQARTLIERAGVDFNAAARSQPAQKGAASMRDAIEGTLDHWLPAAARRDLGAELLTRDTIIRPSMTAVALASTRGLHIPLRQPVRQRCSAPRPARGLSRCRQCVDLGIGNHNGKAATGDDPFCLVEKLNPARRGSRVLLPLLRRRVRSAQATAGSACPATLGRPRNCGHAPEIPPLLTTPKPPETEVRRSFNGSEVLIHNFVGLAGQGLQEQA